MLHLVNQRDLAATTRESLQAMFSADKANIHVHNYDALLSLRIRSRRILLQSGIRA